MPHQLGITPEKTIYRHHGRNARPTDVDGKSLSPLITGSSSHKANEVLPSRSWLHYIPSGSLPPSLHIPE
tara:strand:- start:435 stop:644 length:210 start_codon:yes stop_codon:yes gene_type:complete